MMNVLNTFLNVKNFLLQRVFARDWNTGGDPAEGVSGYDV